MVIKLGGFQLRSWRVGDEHSLVENANNRKIWKNLRNVFPHPYTAEDAKAWIKVASSTKPETNFAIDVAGKAVGGIGLQLKEDVYYRCAEIGYWLGEPFWNRGIMTRAVRAATDYAFGNFDICRLYAGVFDWNGASMRVLEKAGFECEARLKKNITKDGKTGDQLIYAIVIEN